MMNCSGQEWNFVPMQESNTQFVYDVVAGQVLGDIHGFTAPVGIKIDRAYLHGDLERSGIELFISLAYAQ